MIKTPNIFDFATSELSQDAFLCWLIAWADSSQIVNDNSLNGCASTFVKRLLEVSDDYNIETVYPTAYCNDLLNLKALNL